MAGWLAHGTRLCKRRAASVATCRHLQPAVARRSPASPGHPPCSSQPIRYHKVFSCYVTVRPHPAPAVCQGFWVGGHDTGDQIQTPSVSSASSASSSMGCRGCTSHTSASLVTGLYAAKVPLAREPCGKRAGGGREVDRGRGHGHAPPDSQRKRHTLAASPSPIPLLRAAGQSVGHLPRPPQPPPPPLSPSPSPTGLMQLQASNSKAPAAALSASTRASGSG